MPFNPANYEGQDRLGHIEKYLSAVTTGGTDGQILIADSTQPAAVKWVNGSAPISGNRVFSLGDSILNQGFTAVNSMPYAQIGPTAVLPWASLLSQGRIRFAGVAGGSGFTTAQVLNTNLSLAIAAGPEVAIVLAGGNDITGLSAGNLPTVLATAQANLTTIYQRLTTNSILPVCCTYPPRNGVNATEIKALNMLNQWIVRYAERNGLPVIDFHNLLVDPSTNGYTAGLNADNFHPNSAGAKLMGQLISDVLAGTTYITGTQGAADPVLPRSLPWLPGDNGDTSNLLTNGLAITDSGAPVGRPTGWSVLAGAPAAESAGTDTTAIGKYYSMTGIAQMANAASSSTAVAGDLCYMAARIGTTVEASGANAQIRFMDTGGSQDFFSLMGWDKDIPIGSVLAYEFTMPSTGLPRMRCVVQGQANAGANVKIAQLCALNLTAAGIK